MSFFFIWCVPYSSCAAYSALCSEKHLIREPFFYRNFILTHVLSLNIYRWKQNLIVYFHVQRSLYSIWYLCTLLVKNTWVSLIVRIPFAAREWAFIWVEYAFFCALCTRKLSPVISIFRRITGKWKLAEIRLVCYIRMYN